MSLRHCLVTSFCGWHCISKTRATCQRGRLQTRLVESSGYTDNRHQSAMQGASWQLLAQGGAHCIFQRSDVLAMVLRVPKELGAATNVDAGIWQSSYEREQTVRGLLTVGPSSQALTCPSVRIQIQSALLQHLQTLAGQQLSDIGQLLPNLMIPHVQGSNEGHSRQALVLELKPKWGLMPDARWLQAAHAAKLQHSRFELMQKLKAAKAGPAGFRTSHYNPCKLFSRQQPQMQAALHALLEEPQNNLQAFVEGANAGSSAIPAIVASWGVGGGPREIFAQVVSRVLLDSGVLRCLQEVQSLDRFDIESIAPFWAAFSTTLCDPSQASSGCSAQMATHPAASTARVPAVAEQQPVQALSTNMIMGELIRLPEGSAVSCCNMTLLQDALDQAEAGAEGPEDLAASLLQLPQHVGVLTIKAYLLAAMAKDCSIMLSIAPDQGSGTMVESEGAVPPSTTSAMQELQTALQAGMLRGSVQHEQSRAYFSYRLVVIDTDPKPVSKIADHLQLDMNIIAANTNR